MAYNGWHPGRVAGTEGNEARVLKATGSGYEKKNKSWGSRVCHLQHEPTPPPPNFCLRIQVGEASILSTEARYKAIYQLFPLLEDSKSVRGSQPSSVFRRAGMWLALRKLSLKG